MFIYVLEWNTLTRKFTERPVSVPHRKRKFVVDAARKTAVIH